MSIKDPTVGDIRRCNLSGIPEEWTIERLGSVAETEYGISEAASDSPNAEMVSMKHLAGGKIAFDDLIPIRVSEEDAERYRLEENDLVFNRTNSLDLVGKTSLARDIPHSRILFASYLVRVNTDVARLLPEFANSFFNCHLGVARIKSLATPGVGQYNVNPTSLRKQLLIPVPPLPEQRAIASILSTWDRAIELTEKLIAAKQRRKQALMQQLLTGQVRLPGNHLEWSWVKAGGLFESRSVRNNPTEAVLSVTQDQGIVRRDSLDRKIAMDESTTGNYKLVEPNDFVISLRSFQGGLEMSRVRGIVSPAYHVIRAKANLDAEFFRHFFKSYEFIGRLAVAIIGIRDGKQISFKDFSFMKFRFPPVEEQAAIGRILNAAETEIFVLTKRLEKIREQKRGLMQQLLTGNVRVSESNEESIHV